MATATARRKNLVGVDASTIPSTMWAGSYFWYSIPKQSISLDAAREAFRQAGLDDSRLPTERRGEHVMMDACSSVEGVRSNGSRIEIHADQVVRDENFVIYQITRHVWDKQNRLIEHPKALRVLYHFDKGQLSFESLGGTSDDDVAHLRKEIRDYFRSHGASLSGHNFRTILRHYVEAAGAENMRGQSGGVYFLAQRNELGSRNRLRPHHGDVIDGEQFIASVKKALEIIYGRAPEWHRIPCINDAEQREFLKRKFIENCTEDLKAYRDDCLELASGMIDGEERKRGIREDKRTGMVERRKEIDIRRRKFADILGDTLGELERDMALADKALKKFLTEADA